MPEVLWEQGSENVKEVRRDSLANGIFVGKNHRVVTCTSNSVGATFHEGKPNGARRRVGWETPPLPVCPLNTNHKKFYFDASGLR
jgi:hypothetical protein